ncbi:MAG: type II secretion system F family protein [Rhodobacteraceae bacterium]|nr:type II secretion system F family protein [Paracoccaceae bacterium]
MEILNALDAMITDLLGPFGPLIVLGVLGLFMVLLTLPFLVNQREDPMKKLQRSIEKGTEVRFEKERLRQGARNEQLQRFANFLEPKDVDELSAVQLKLTQAGYRSKDAVRIFYFAQMVLAVLGLVGGLVYVIILNADQGMSTQQLVIYTVGPGLAGYMLPKYWVGKRVDARKSEITSGFPDSLDMMLVCVEAGQSLDQSIVRVARELRASYPALADEYETVAYEMKAGKDKSTVLKDMGTRCGVQDVSSFVTVMVQSATFGTSISDALRVYSAEMRDKRVMRAEEAANKLPTKMTLATMMLTVPPLLIILVGPSIHGITTMGN